MLAARNRRESHVCEVDRGQVGARTPYPVFKAAYKELCTRIWIELELLMQSAQQVDIGRPRDLVMVTAILRLELIVLVDSCRSPGWRSMLAAEQCESLCSMLTDVLAALYVDSEHLRKGIAEAQDRILDELQPAPEAWRSPPDPASHVPLGRSSHSAADELVSLIEARAASRAAR